MRCTICYQKPWNTTFYQQLYDILNQIYNFKIKFPKEQKYYRLKYIYIYIYILDV